MKFKKSIIITLFLLSFLMIGFVSASSDNVVNSDLTTDSNQDNNGGFDKTSPTIKQCNDKNDVCLKSSASKNVVSETNDDTKSDDEDEDYDKYENDEEYENEDYTSEYEDGADAPLVYANSDDDNENDENNEDDEDYTSEYEEGEDAPLYETDGEDAPLVYKNSGAYPNKETKKQKHNSNEKYLNKNKDVIKKSLYNIPNKTSTKNTSNSQSNNKPAQEDTTSIQNSNNNQQDYFQTLTNQFDEIKELFKNLQNLFFRLLFSFKEII